MRSGAMAGHGGVASIKMSCVHHGCLSFSFAEWMRGVMQAGSGRMDLMSPNARRASQTPGEARRSEDDEA
jgi:hypothetical protein